MIITEFVYDGSGNAYYRCFYITMKTAISVGMNVKPVIKSGQSSTKCSTIANYVSVRKIAYGVIVYDRR